jgi:hypothetical protein
LRRPKKWHSELMLYVAWWSTSIRTAPPHSRPVRPVATEPPIAQPRKNGTTRPAATQSTKVRLMKATTGSFIRSGA